MYDRVLAFEEGEHGDWRVRVERVEKKPNGSWVATEGPRWLSDYDESDKIVERESGAPTVPPEPAKPSPEDALRAKEDEAKRIIATDKEINDQIDIDERCLKLLATQTPLAVDLRLITSAMKINADLERVGVQAVTVAEGVLVLLPPPPATPLTDIPRMAAIAEKMIKDALDALVHASDRFRMPQRPLLAGTLRSSHRAFPTPGLTSSPHPILALDTCPPATAGQRQTSTGLRTVPSKVFAEEYLRK